MGNHPITSIVLNYKLDNNAPVSATFPLNLTPGAQVNLSFPNVTWTAGIHTICAYPTLAGDSIILMILFAEHLQEFRLIPCLTTITLTELLHRILSILQQEQPIGYMVLPMLQLSQLRDLPHRQKLGHQFKCSRRVY